jgi:hypothetical protein
MMIWPFKDLASGARIYKDRFYGFGDAGGLAGSFEGYETREEAINHIKTEYEEGELGTKPEDLGSYGITVLSGEEYVNRLKTILGDNETLESMFGSWSGE